MNPSTILETKRLVLRTLVPQDLAALAALYRDPEVRRFYPEGTLSEQATEDELRWTIDVYYAQYGYGLWATVLRETGAFIGRCGLLPWEIEGQAEVEVAYMLARPFWGQGLATEAAKAICDYGFATLPVRRLIALIDKDNHASARVAEKIGMRFVQEIDDGKGPAQLYALDRADWVGAR